MAPHSGIFRGKIVIEDVNTVSAKDQQAQNELVAEQEAKQAEQRAHMHNVLADKQTLEYRGKHVRPLNPMKELKTGLFSSACPEVRRGKKGQGLR